jgi:hypothetical protein
MSEKRQGVVNHGSQKAPKSLCFYDGPSVLDGQPILGIVTGLKDKPGLASENPKTGAMVMTWIIRKDVAPHLALHSGQDESVCGQCPLRPFTAKGTGNPLCYASCSGGRAGIVNIYRSYEMGNIPTLLPSQSMELLRGKKVRVGAYGDPAAIPYMRWAFLLHFTEATIGYTHQWRTCDGRFRNWLMASVDSEEERREAKEMGWRTFRIGSSRQTGEVVCPGSVEAGRILTCSACLHCDGWRTERKSDVVIAPHGPSFGGGL